MIYEGCLSICEVAFYTEEFVMTWNMREKVPESLDGTFLYIIIELKPIRPSGLGP